MKNVLKCYWRDGRIDRFYNDNIPNRVSVSEPMCTPTHHTMPLDGRTKSPEEKTLFVLYGVNTKGMLWWKRKTGYYVEEDSIFYPYFS